MWSAEKFGRKRNIQLGCFLSVLGGILQGGAATLAYGESVPTDGSKADEVERMFQAGRFVAGCGIGILVTICPMYLAEISSPFQRGWLVGHHAIFLVFGYMLAGWIGYGCYFATRTNPSFAWRFPLCLQVLAPLILLVGSPSLPRSPRWLISKGLTDEAFDVIKRMRMTTQDEDHIVAKEEFHQTKEQLKLEAEKLAASGNNIWTMAWKKKSYRKRLIIGFMTQWGAEFSGPLIINNYAVILYTNLGETGNMPLLLSAVWITTAGLIYNPFGAWLHDRVNSRRGMYLVGLIGCLITTSLLAAMTASYSGTTNRVGNAMGILFIFLYLAFQGTCCDTTMYIYVSEIFPTELRPIGMGFSSRLRLSCYKQRQSDSRRSVGDTTSSSSAGV
jgi:MFS family permease